MPYKNMNPDSSSQPPGGAETLDSRLAAVRWGLLARYPWAIYVLPFLVYMLLGHLEPTPAARQVGLRTDSSAGTVGQNSSGGSGADQDSAGGTEPLHGYPLYYALHIALTIATIVLVMPGYSQFPLRVSWLSLAVGVVGIVLWVGICRLDLETRLLVPLGLGPLIEQGARAAFDPLRSLGDRPALLVAFLAIRFLGLVAVVPLIEEFFLRGFLMRLVASSTWWRLPLNQVNTAAIAAGTVYGVLSHPAEMFAAAVWFSLVTWLMMKTGSIWDCVAAHAVTNLLLGAYVLWSHQWALW